MKNFKHSELLLKIHWLHSFFEHIQFISIVRLNVRIYTKWTQKERDQLNDMYSEYEV